MRCARPSTIAVLPTPGSPISTGLFLVRRCRIWMQRRISSSRPITGSSLPCCARSVRSSVNFFNACRCPSSACEETFSPPRTCSTAFSSEGFEIPQALKTRPMSPLSEAQASRKSSEAMYWSPRFCASLSATLSRLVRSRDRCTSPGVPSTLGRESMDCSRFFLREFRFPPALLMSPATPPSSWLRSASSRCWGSICWWSRPSARLWASASPVCSWVVNLSNRMGLIPIVFYPTADGGILTGIKPRIVP